MFDFDPYYDDLLSAPDDSRWDGYDRGDLDYPDAWEYEFDALECLGVNLYRVAKAMTPVAPFVESESDPDDILF